MSTPNPLRRSNTDYSLPSRPEYTCPSCNKIESECLGGHSDAICNFCNKRTIDCYHINEICPTCNGPSAFCGEKHDEEDKKKIQKKNELRAAKHEEYLAEVRKLESKTLCNLCGDDSIGEDHVHETQCTFCGEDVSICGEDHADEMRHLQLSKERS